MVPLSLMAPKSVSVSPGSLLVLLVSLVLTSAELRDVECSSNQHRIGNRCVEKVPFSELGPGGGRRACPEPHLLRGNTFLRMEGRMMDFYCDTDYILVPNTEVAICRVTGEWSKQIPVCLKPGCKEPSAPEHGTVELQFESTLATFSCNPGYMIQGSAYLGCEDGEHWNSSVPACRRIHVETTMKTISVKSSGICIGTGLRGILLTTLATVLYFR